MNPYKVLGVRKNASQKTIKAAYRELCKEHHPDKGGDTKKMAEIAAAYEILSNKGRRSDYDRTGNTSDSPSLDKMAEDLLCHTFSSMLKNNNLKIDEYTDIMEHLEVGFERGRREGKLSLYGMKKDRTEILKISCRIRCKEGKDLLSEICQGEIEKIESSMASCIRGVRIIIRAARKLQNYEFTQEHDNTLASILAHHVPRQSLGFTTAWTNTK